MSTYNLSLVDPDGSANYIIGSYVIVEFPELTTCAVIVREKSERKARAYHRVRFERAGLPALQPGQEFDIYA